jgi:excinuclease ABC subunit B
MYADKVTDSMQQTIDETYRRREKQQAYNEAHGIEPKALSKSKDQILAQTRAAGAKESYADSVLKGVDAAEEQFNYNDKVSLEKAIEKTRKEMEKAAKALDFIQAASLRDRLLNLEAKRSTVKQ